MRKLVSIAAVITLIYILVVFLSAPFLPHFGKKGVVRQVVDIFLNFPVPLTANIPFLPYLGSIILNGISWGVCFLFIGVILRNNKKSDDDQELIDND